MRGRDTRRSCSNGFITSGLDVKRIEILRRAAVEVAKSERGAADQTDASDLVRCAQLRDEFTKASDDVVAVQ